MELTNAERIAWGVWSFIMLIVYLRWFGTPEDQKEVSPRSESNPPAESEENQYLSKEAQPRSLSEARKR
jgi:hypothetical protein